jgi:hypothetical protein
VLRVHEVFGWHKEDFRKVTTAQIVANIAERCAARKIRVIYADMFEATGLAGLFAQHQIRYRAYHWSAQSKEDAIALLRTYVRDKTLSLPRHDALLNQLLSIRAIPQAGGTFRYTTGGKDYAAALISILHALNDPEVVGVDIDSDAMIQKVSHAASRRVVQWVGESSMGEPAMWRGNRNI